ncbi:peptidoglycan DD-metalloendopeptidase family protein [Chryseobacterium chendengshani]|uniref:peptidoglycan DD-metalloendopeptidase family protein n=1 Tax=Chryseobacterium sp. LJ756 TaxID=2864113 RepID=UPI001C64263C|nr:peptidoglycan DD-metalloendopeptidase family protein [Chryseobacterium sp. LJ756]MBW7676325.1 peptidoglycan DD-metalloendopeptidase family protein [Chryseobacterium sp. LJ756]
MSKKGVSKITGNTSPKIGEATVYSVTDWYPATPQSQRSDAAVTWELFKKRSNGRFTSTNIKKTGTGTFTFGEVAQRNTYRLEAYLYEPEGNGPTTLEINPQPVAIPRINKVELQYVDDTPGTVFSYSEKLRARAQCVNLTGQKLKFSLWEDDAVGEGHNASNLLIETKESTVDRSGVATAEFMLTRALMQKAMRGETDPQKLEFYVTVEYFSDRKHATDNIHVNNPSHIPASTPQTRPQSGNTTPPPATQSPRPSSNVPPRAQGSPAESKPQSQKEEKGILDTVKNWWDNLELWDWGESQGTINPTQTPTQQPAGGRTVSVVQDSAVEELLDAYFAKKEYTKQTGEVAGSFEYTIGSNGNRSATDAEKNRIAGIILGKSAVKALAEKKEYTTLEAIKAGLTKDIYNKNEKVTFQTFKLGAEFKKVNSAPLDTKLYLVARTSGLNGKQATLIIKEKDGLLKGSAGAVLPILEITEAQMEQATPATGEVPGTEKSQFTATIENGVAKVPIHLRPKSNDELKIWKDKLTKGKEDGTYDYTFAGATAIANETAKKNIAKAILTNAKEGKRGNPKIEDGKAAYLEDIEKSLEIKTYNPGDKITFKLYKKEPELLYIQAKAQGEKQHDKDFLKTDGAYFTVGKNCECEQRIRAFMRMLRIGEGTEGEKGYTTQYSGAQFSDMSTHPETVITAGAYSSSAAGAYQIMRYTYWWLKGEKLTSDNKKAGVYEESHDYVKKYSIPDFTAESQDKLCVIILKHKRSGSLDLITKNQIKESLEQYGSYEWASLPPGRYGQPAQTMDVALAKYEKFLSEELAGTSDLHIKKGFLKEFGIPCNCGNEGGSSDWHHPLARMELRGWYGSGFSPQSSDHGDAPIRHSGSHDGLDLYAPIGTQVYACVTGEVHEVYESTTYGNTINIKGDYKGTTYYFFYAHLSEVNVSAKDPVVAGNPIGKTGQTGNASGQESKMNHLHFEVRTTGNRTGGRVDPLTTIAELKTGVNTSPDQTTQI